MSLLDNTTLLHTSMLMPHQQCGKDINCPKAPCSDQAHLSNGSSVFVQSTSNVTPTLFISSAFVISDTVP